MDAKSLTVGQRGAIRRQVLRHREYLGKLAARMESLGWPADEPMRVSAVQSRDAVQGILDALEAAEPAAPFLSHYGPAGPSAVLPDVSGTADLPWVGKRNARRR
jgi:hypothetical protein